MVKIHEGPRWPDLPLKLFARDRLAGMREQNLEDLERLNLNFDSDSVLAQLPSIQVGDEVAEPDNALG